MSNVANSIVSAPVAAPANGVAPPVAAPVAPASAKAPTAPAPEVVEKPIDRANAAVERARAAAAKHREQLTQQKQLADAQRRIAELEPSAAELKMLAKFAEEDPVQLLELLGSKYKLSAEKFVAAIKRMGTPEAAQAAREREIEERATKAATAELNALKQQMADEKASQMYERNVKFVLDEAAKHTTISTVPDDVVIGEVNKMLDIIFKETGAWDTYPLEEVVAEVEKRFSAKRKVESAEETQAAAAAAPAPGSNAKQPAPHRAKTLTQSMTTASISAPESIDSVPRHKRLDHLTAIYEANRSKK